MKKGLSQFAAVLVVLLFVSPSLAVQNAAPARKGLAPARPAVKGETLRMKKLRCIDHKGIGTEAFSLLIPADWKFDGGVQWVLDNPGMPAVAKFTVKSPAGSEVMEVFPNQALFWTDSPMHRGMFPVGSKYFGAEVRPVASPREALKGIVLPRFRGNVTGLKVVQSKELPELARALGAGRPQQGVRTFGNAAKVRIEYVKNGMAMEEEIFAVVEGFSYPIQTMQGPVTNTNWFVDYIFSFRAPKGQLDRKMPLFKTMVNSFRVNPRWFSRYNQVVEQLIQAQIRQIHSMGELSKIISRTHNEISDSTMKSWNDRQKVYDRIGENASESIRGTEHYHNPFEDSTVELPGQYSHVWTNASGEYVFTDSPGYNPNIGSSKNWQEIQPK